MSKKLLKELLEDLKSVENFINNEKTVIAHDYSMSSLDTFSIPGHNGKFSEINKNSGSPLATIYTIIQNLEKQLSK